MFRENTEGVYVGIGGRFKAGTTDEIAVQEEINTYKGVHRIIVAAFEHAVAKGRTQVCMADKSNAMAQGHALWQWVFKEVSAEYPAIRATHMFIDALAMSMIKDPSQFEVIVTNNLFGDIITDLGAPAGRPRDGRFRQHPSGPDVALRTGAWICAEVRRQERRGSGRCDSLGGADPRDGGLARRSRAHRSRGVGCGDVRPCDEDVAVL